jgi:hypothetical protein
VCVWSEGKDSYGFHGQLPCFLVCFAASLFFLLFLFCMLMWVQVEWSERGACAFEVSRRRPLFSKQLFFSFCLLPCVFTHPLPSRALEGQTYRCLCSMCVERWPLFLCGAP